MQVQYLLISSFQLHFLYVAAFILIIAFQMTCLSVSKTERSWKTPEVIYEQLSDIHF